MSFVDWLRGVAASLRGPSDRTPPALPSLRDRLRLVASALAGEKLEVREATDGIGGHEGGALLLPPSLRAVFGADREEAAFLFRVAFGVTSRRLGHRLPGGATGVRARLLHTWLAVAEAIAALDEALPGSAQLRRELSSLELAGRPSLSSLSPRAAALEWLARATLGERATPRDPDVRRFVEEATARVIRSAELPVAGAALLERLERLPGTRDAPPPVMMWGTLLPWQRTVAAPGDGDEQAAAGRRRRAKARAMVPPDDRATEEDEHDATGDPAGEATGDAVAAGDYRADLAFAARAGAAVEDPTLGEHRYDEWDERRRAYRLDWCSVQVSRPRPILPEADAAAYVTRVVTAREREIRALRSAFARVAQRREWRHGQRDGTDVDVDALVDRHALLRSGHLPPEKLYLDRRRARSELATFVLLDASLSTFSHHGAQSIIDIQRDSVLVLGEAVAGVHDQLGVAAFASETRHRCRFLVVKDFDEPWQRARLRLPQLSPDGGTRIGAALRHASWLLARTPARRKLLLLLSDGKPMDVDGYEGRHGIADVRQALREARRQGVHVFALTVDAEAREHLPRMFGRGSFEILPDPGQLARRLARLHHDLLRL